MRSAGSSAPTRTYANIAIEAALTMRMVFHLPLQQTDGFLRSPAHMLELEIPVPDHTTLSRRFKKVGELVWSKAVDRSICSSTARVSGSTSVLCENQRSRGSGESCTDAAISQACHLGFEEPIPSRLAHRVASKAP